MPEFLLEVGCEELPASFVEKAYSDLAGALAKELEALGLKNSEPVAMGTPRRLIVSFPDLKPRQEDSTKEQRGPSLSAAYGTDGNPTPALLGFCKSQGISPNDLRKDDQYVWVTKHIPGRDTSDVLAEILPKIILGLNFEKSMRWGASKVRFARPIRWVLAAFGGEQVSFNVEDVPSALLSQGHRFYAPDAFEAKTLDELTRKLRAALVEPEVEKRKEKILAETHSVAMGTPEISDDLLDENAFLTEWPTAIRGTFPESYLELPEPVLVTAMAKHERMFPIRDAAGKLTNAFVFIRNSGEDDTVRRGCEWVLGARFNDARFFYEQDQKLTLDDFLEKTKDILFQAQLGTVRQRADRLAKLCSFIAEAFHAEVWDGVSENDDERRFTDEELRWAEKAGLYAKADLATGLVSELSSLQGVIGSEYARSEGMPEAVVNAIAAQYMTPSEPIVTRADKIGAILIIADQIDKLAGYLGLGLEPSGSSDPFGLRKSVTTLIRTAENGDGWAGVCRFSLMLSHSIGLYREQGFELDQEKAIKSLTTIFRSRYEALYDQFTHDVFAAAIPEGHMDVTSPRWILNQLKLVNSLKANELFVQTAARPINIVNAARKKGEAIGGWADLDLDLIGTPDGLPLWNAADVWDMGSGEEYLLSLVGPINAFFDNNMVMDEDATLRYHRLTLASAVADAILSAGGDFTKLEG